MTKTRATTEIELEQIRRAALDYFEGWFDGDVERMDRALHPDLVKRRGRRGARRHDEGADARAHPARRGHEDGADRRLDVEVEDVHGDIASVTVRSAVYHEYLHLVRTRDGWKIANALWRPT